MPDPGIVQRPEEAPGEAQYNRAVAFAGQPVADQYKAEVTANLIRAGKKPEDISAWWGEKPASSNDWDKSFQGNLQRNLGTNGVTAAKTPAEALAAGWNMSVSGLAINKHVPTSAVPENAPIINQVLSGAAQMAGDLPAAIPGAIAGALGGGSAGALVPVAGETGGSEAVGALAGGGFGFNATPSAARQIMIDAYRRGEYKSWNDVMSAATKSTVQVMKDGTVGALSNVVGGAIAGKVAGVIGAKVLAKGGTQAAADTAAAWGGGAANLTTQAFGSSALGAAMNGRVPDAKDFITGAILALGAHATGHYVGGRYAPSEAEQRVQKNMEDIYARTGMMPQEQASRAAHDPVFRQEVGAQDVNGDPVHPIISKNAQNEPPPYEPPKPEPENPDLDKLDEAIKESGVRQVEGHVVHPDIVSELDKRYDTGQSPRPRDITPPKTPTNPMERGLVVRNPTEITPIIKGIETGGLSSAQSDAAVSPAGAIGRYQIMPGTARQYGFDPSRLHEGAYNEQVHTAIMTDLYRRYNGNVNAMLIAYNAGPGRANRYMAAEPGTGLVQIKDPSMRGGYRYERINVDRDESHLPLETQQYLAKARRLSGGKMPVGEPTDLGHDGVPGSQGVHEGPAMTVAEMEAMDKAAKPEEEAPLDLTDKVALTMGGANDLSSASSWKGASTEDLTREMLSNVGEQPKRDFLSPSKIASQFVSELSPGRAVDNRLVAAGEMDRTRDYGVEDALRSTYGSSGRAGIFARFGTVDPVTKVVNPDAPTALKAANLVKANGGDMDGFRAYLLAKRTVQKSKTVADPAAKAQAEADISSAKLAQTIERGAVDPVKQPAKYAKMVARHKAENARLQDRLTEASAGIDTGFNLAAARELANHPDAQAKYDEAVKMWNGYNDGFLEYMVGSGMITPESAARMQAANSDAYVSMRRIRGDNVQAGKGRGFGVSNTLHRMEGSDGQIIDPILATLDNQRVGIQMADRNMARAHIIEKAKADPKLAALIGLRKVGTVDPNYDEVDGLLHTYGFKDGKEMDDAREAFGSLITARQEKALAPNEFMFFNKGKAERWQVDSPELAQVLRNADSVGETNAVMSIARTFAAANRAGIVVQPDFPARMTIWHQFNQFLMDPLHPTPIATWLSGIGHVLKQDALYQELVANGGLGAAMVDLDRDWLARDMERIFTDTGVWPKVWNMVVHPLELSQIVGEKMDAANRVGYYKLAISKGIEPRKAGMMSRKAGLDYGERATSQLVNNLSQVVPFFRPHLLGLKQGWEAIEDQGTSGGKAAMIGGVAVKTAFGLVVRGTAAITMTSVAMYMLNRMADQWLPDGEKYEDLPRWERDRMLITPPINGVRLKLRMPANYGIWFHTLPTRMLDAMWEHDPKAFQDFGKDFLAEYVPDPTPAIAKPAMEVAANHSFYTGKPLISDSMRERSPDLQYTENTTEPAKALAKVIGAGSQALGGPGVSAIDVEHLVSGYLGPAGMMAMRAINAPFDQSHRLGQLADMPIIQGFVVRHPGMDSQHVEDFYDTYHEFTEQAGDFKFLKQRARALGQTSIDLTQFDPDMALASRGLGNVAKALAVQRSLVLGIQHNPTMTDDEKRQHIENVYSQMVTTATYGSAEMEVIKDKRLNHDQKESQMQAVQAKFQPMLDKIEASQ